MLQIRIGEPTRVSQVTHDLPGLGKARMGIRSQNHALMGSKSVEDYLVRDDFPEVLMVSVYPEKGGEIDFNFLLNEDMTPALQVREVKGRIGHADLNSVSKSTLAAIEEYQDSLVDLVKGRARADASTLMDFKVRNSGLYIDNDTRKMLAVNNTRIEVLEEVIEACKAHVKGEPAPDFRAMASRSVCMPETTRKAERCDMASVVEARGGGVTAFPSERIEESVAMLVASVVKETKRPANVMSYRRNMGSTTRLGFLSDPVPDASDRLSAMIKKGQIGNDDVLIVECLPPNDICIREVARKLWTACVDPVVVAFSSEGIVMGKATALMRASQPLTSEVYTRKPLDQGYIPPAPRGRPGMPVEDDEPSFRM